MVYQPRSLGKVVQSNLTPNLDGPNSEQKEHRRLKTITQRDLTDSFIYYRRCGGPFNRAALATSKIVSYLRLACALTAVWVVCWLAHRDFLHKRFKEFLP